MNDNEINGNEWKYIKECLDSIKNQIGNTCIELVWINDGSDKLNTILLKKLLDDFSKTTRFTKVVYSENDGNKGLGYSLNKGVHLCTHEIVLKHVLFNKMKKI